MKMQRDSYISIGLIVIAAAILLYIVMDYDSKGKETTPEVAPIESFSPVEGMDTLDAPLASAPEAAPEPSKPTAMKGSALPKNCSNSERLTAEDLLPKNAGNTKWAEVNPSGKGTLEGRSYLTAGHHIGLNTVGSTMRNANMQLRSEFPNPKMENVSPWHNSSIDADVNRKHLEIGGDY